MDTVGDTKLLSCSRCGIEKDHSKFIKNRHICKECDNKRKRNKYELSVTEETMDKVCIHCNVTKISTEFIRCRNICKHCNNIKRREKYKNNEELRSKLIQRAIEYKQNKASERQKIKEETIGKDNKKCSNCSIIKDINRFRFNRLNP